MNWFLFLFGIGIGILFYFWTWLLSQLWNPYKDYPYWLMDDADADRPKRGGRRRR